MTTECLRENEIAKSNLHKYVLNGKKSGISDSARTESTRAKQHSDRIGIRSKELQSKKKKLECDAKKLSKDIKVLEKIMDGMNRDLKRLQQTDEEVAKMIADFKKGVS